MKKAYKWTIALILLGFVTAGIFLTLAPERIPAHFNIRGEVDRWGSKYEFFIMPVIGLLFGIFMAWLADREGRLGRDMNERIIRIMNNWILVLFNGMWLFFMWNAVDLKDPGGSLGDAAAKAMLMVLMASFFPMGNIMPKAQRNSAFGLRTRWSMTNDHCWQQSQRIGGYTMVVTGIAGVILMAVLPVAWAGYAMMGLILIMAIGCTCASYRVYQRDRVRRREK